jgi:hypothetical protein
MIVTNKILKSIIISLLLLLSSIHIQKIIFKGIGLNQITLVIAVFLGIAILKESRALYSISFYLFSVGYILSGPSIGLEPVIGFFIALLYFNNSKTILAIITGLPVFLVLNFFIYERVDFENLVLLIIGISGILLFLYLAVIKQPENIEKLSKITPLTKRQLLILKYLAMDIPRKQIPSSVKDSTLWRLGLDRDKFTVDIINTEIAKVKKELEIVNGEALGVWYNKQVEISNKGIKNESE